MVINHNLYHTMLANFLNKSSSYLEIDSFVCCIEYYDYLLDELCKLPTYIVWINKLIPNNVRLIATCPNKTWLKGEWRWHIILLRDCWRESLREEDSSQSVRGRRENKRAETHKRQREPSKRKIVKRGREVVEKDGRFYFKYRWDEGGFGRL